VRKVVCLVGYYGGLRTNEIRAIEFNKVFSAGEKSFEMDENGFWFTFERSKQRGKVETTTICVPRRTNDWLPVVSDSFRCPVDLDPASIIDEYLALIQSDFNQSLEELEGPFFRSTHGKNGVIFSKLPLGVNTLSKIPVEFATQLLLPNALSYTGHCWRRSCGTNASDAGVNVTTLMAQMGWTTPKTALGYVAKSKITSFKMSMFLSNIQRRNKYLDSSGLKSTPKGVQLSKLDECPRLTKKKLDPVKVDVGRVGVQTNLGFHLIGESCSDNDVRLIASQLEDHELIVSAAEAVSSESKVCSENQTSSSPSLIKNDCSSIESASSIVSNAGVSGEISASSVSSSESSSNPLSGIDSRVSAILQNFQNHGSVQIHLHFHGKN
jgi:hypothetical protein